MNQKPTQAVRVQVKHVMFPCYSQLVVVPRERVSYLYSLWIGVSTPVLNLPRMLWAFILRPVLYGALLILSVVATSLVAGIAGRAAGVQLLPFAEAKADATGV